MHNSLETFDYLREQHDDPTQSWYRLCLSLARKARGLDGLYPTAWSQWINAKQRHKITSDTVDWEAVPRCSPLFYYGPPSGGVLYGHVTTFWGIHKSIGPLCWTNDAKRTGGVDMVHPLWFESHWGHELVGWTGDLAGVDLKLGQSIPGVKHCSLLAVQRAARFDPKRPQGQTTPGSEDDVRLVEGALVKWGSLDSQYSHDGAFGTATRAAYKEWQQYLGYSGSDANGIPGPVSLQRLGARYGFRTAA